MSYRNTLHPHERQRVDGYFRPGMHAGRLRERDDFGSWKVIRETSHLVVMRHYNGAIMRVGIRNNRAMFYRLYEGDAVSKAVGKELDAADLRALNEAAADLRPAAIGAPTPRQHTAAAVASSSTDMPAPKARVPSTPPTPPMAAPLRHSEGVIVWGRGRITSGDVSADGSTVVVGTSVGVFVLDGATLEKRLVITTPQPVVQLAVSADGGIAAGTLTNVATHFGVGGRASPYEVRTWRTDTGEVVDRKTSTDEVIPVLAGSRVVRLAKYELPKAIVAQGRVGNGRHVMVGRDDVVLREASTFKQVERLDWPHLRVDALALRDDGAVIVEVTEKRRANNRSWSFLLETEEAVPFPSTEPLSSDGTLRTRIRLRHYTTRIMGDSEEVSEPCDIELVEVATGEVRHTLSGCKGRLGHHAFDPSGQSLAAGYEGGMVRIFDVQTGAELRRFKSRKAQFVRVCFAPDGLSLAAAERNGVIHVFELDTGERLFELCGHTNWVRDLAFTVDGAWLASTGFDGTVRLWSMTGGEHRVLGQHCAEANQVLFVDRDRRLLSAGNDGAVRSWEIPDGA